MYHFELEQTISFQIWVVGASICRWLLTPWGAIFDVQLHCSLGLLHTLLHMLSALINCGPAHLTQHHGQITKCHLVLSLSHTNHHWRNVILACTTLFDAAQSQICTLSSVHFTCNSASLLIGLNFCGLHIYRIISSSPFTSNIQDETRLKLSWQVIVT